MPKIDLTNKEYEYYTVLHRNNEKKGKNVWWDCQCHCGKIFTATTTDINRQKQKSCGCMRAKLIGEAHFQDLKGQIFGELKVIERDLDHVQNGEKPRTYWWCECSCGNRISVDRTHLVNRGQSSCGCKQSIGELNIIKLLTDNNIKFKSQYTCSDLHTTNNGYLRFDFAILDENNTVIRLIEFDGPQHASENNYFNDFSIIERDKIKDNYAQLNKIPLVRVPYYKRDCITVEDLMGDRFLI